MYSPQKHHAICHESSNSDICNRNISMIDLKSHEEENMVLMQLLLTALFTPANPKQYTEVFNCQAD